MSARAGASRAVRPVAAMALGGGAAAGVFFYAALRAVQLFLAPEANPATVIISAHAGLTAFGGSEGVGSATTRAVVGSSLAVIVLNFIISGTGYVVFGP